MDSLGPGWYLVSLSKCERPHIYNLKNGINSIGRGYDSDLCIKSRMVSRKHCTILIREDQIFLKDEKSFNGTYLNSLQTPPEVFIGLSNGDTICLGSASNSDDPHVRHLYKVTKHENQPLFPNSSNHKEQGKLSDLKRKSLELPILPDIKRLRTEFSENEKTFPQSDSKLNERSIPVNKALPSPIMKQNSDMLINENTEEKSSLASAANSEKLPCNFLQNEFVPNLQIENQPKFVPSISSTPNKCSLEFSFALDNVITISDSDDDLSNSQLFIKGLPSTNGNIVNNNNDDDIEEVELNAEEMFEQHFSQTLSCAVLPDVDDFEPAKLDEIIPIVGEENINGKSKVEQNPNININDIDKCKKNKYDINLTECSIKVVSDVKEKEKTKVTGEKALNPQSNDLLSTNSTENSCIGAKKCTQHSQMNEIYDDNKLGKTAIEVKKVKKLLDISTEPCNKANNEVNNDPSEFVQKTASPKKLSHSKAAKRNSTKNKETNETRLEEIIAKVKKGKLSKKKLHFLQDLPNALKKSGGSIECVSKVSKKGKTRKVVKANLPPVSENDNIIENVDSTREKNPYKQIREYKERRCKSSVSELKKDKLNKGNSKKGIQTSEIGDIKEGNDNSNKEIEGHTKEVPKCKKGVSPKKENIKIGMKTSNSKQITVFQEHEGDVLPRIDKISQLKCSIDKEYHKVEYTQNHLKAATCIISSNFKKANVAEINVSDMNEKIVKRRVTFKEGFEVRTFECEGILKKLMPVKGRTIVEPPAKEPPIRKWISNLKTCKAVIDICNWNLAWLEQCKVLAKDPPVVKGCPLALTDNFISYEDYWRSVYPLLMYELWANMAKDVHAREQNKSTAVFNGVIQEISVNIHKNHRFPITLSCRCMLLAKRSELVGFMRPKFGDLIGVQQRHHKPANNKEVFRSFAVITSTPIIQPLRHYSSDQYVNSIKKSDPKSNPNKSVEDVCIILEITLRHSKSYSIEKFNLLDVSLFKNLTKDLRLFDTLEKVPTSSLFQLIIDPKKYYPLPKIDNEQKLVTLFPLNENQKNAVISCSQSALIGKPNISLIHGPPGTGKTTVITSIILQILQQLKKKSKRRGKILLCAPTNAAVDELVIRLLDIRKGLKEKFKLTRYAPHLDIVHPLVREVTPPVLAKKEIDCNLNKESIELELKILYARELSCKLALETNRCTERLTSQLFQEQEKIRMYETLLNKNSCGDILKSNERSKMISEEEKIVIFKADIIACTLASCFSQKIIEALYDNSSSDSHFCCCIVDEATQAIEPEVLMPILHNVNNLILVGDPKQLPATVLSQTAKSLRFDKSIYHRLFKSWVNIPDAPLYRLTVQHRMHPEIAAFPSSYFYEGLLETPSFLNVDFKFRPYTVVAHKFPESHLGESNEKESELIVELLACMVESKLFIGMNTAIITPYQQQKGFISKLISERPPIKKALNCDVNTIDSFQGKERDMVIFSTVRTDGMGFLIDPQRLNVALTRARKCLIIIGNFSSLQKDSTWKALLSDAKQRDAYYDLGNSKNFQMSALVKFLLLKSHKRKSK